MKKENNLKLTSYISVITMLVLLLLAIVYYKERSIFMDSSYILFQIVNDGHFAIQENRFGSLITHVIPLVFSKLNFNIKTIIIGYTLSFNIFYLSVLSFMVFKLKEYALAILMSFYYLLFVSDTFYWSNNEVHQGVSWMFLTLALLHYGALKKVKLYIQIIIMLIFGFLAVSSHMLVAMPFAFLFIYIFFDKNFNSFSKNEKLVLPILLSILIFIKYCFSLNQNYDGEKLKLIDKLSLKDITYYITNDFGTNFINSCFKEYWLVLILLLIGLFALILQKKWVLLVLTILGLFLYYTFMCVVFSNTGSYEKFHIESEWMGLGIIAASPFVFEFLTKKDIKNSIVIVILISIIRLFCIEQSADKFKLRLHTSEKIISSMKNKNITKLALIDCHELRSIYFLDWSLQEESLLLSCLNNEKPLRTFFIYKKDDVLSDFSDSKSIFVGCFHNYTFPEINFKYFNFDTSTNYKLLSYNQLIR